MASTLASYLGRRNVVAPAITVSTMYSNNINNTVYMSVIDSGQTAANLTTSGLPGTAPSGSVLSGSYRLTAGASSGATAMSLGSYTYNVGTTYYFTFTGMQGSQALALYVYQYNSAGTGYTQVSASVASITTTASTITGSFTPNASGTYTGTIVFYFQALAVNQYVNFTSFRMTVGGMNVGIGTSNPSALLHVNGGNITVNYGSMVCLHSTYSTGGSYSLGGAGNNLRIALNSDTSTNRLLDIGYYTSDNPSGTWNSKMVVNPISGYVGIGTNNPAQALHVYGTNPYLYLGATASNYNVAQFSFNTVSSGSTYNYVSLQIYNSPITLCFNGLGYVGIGNTNPSYKLDVVGDARASGSLIIGTGGTYTPGCIFANGDWGMILRAYTASPAVNKFLVSDNADTHLFGVDLNNRLYISQTLRGSGVTRDSGICRLTINSDYNDANSGFAINASDSTSNNYFLRLYPYTTVGGYVGYSFQQYNGSTYYNSININQFGRVGLLGNMTPVYPLDVGDNGGGYGSVRCGGIISSGFGQDTYGQFRMIQGNYGTFFRNDGSNTYLLLTNSGDQYGQWNSIRPWYVDNSNGNNTFGTWCIQLKMCYGVYYPGSAYFYNNAGAYYGNYAPTNVYSYCIYSGYSQAGYTNSVINTNPWITVQMSGIYTLTWIAGGSIPTGVELFISIAQNNGNELNTGTAGYWGGGIVATHFVYGNAEATISWTGYIGVNTTIRFGCYNGSGSNWYPTSNPYRNAMCIATNVVAGF